ncbi:sigma-70 family RNA polymerase sigma factor [Lentzea sp. BCCO 10_0798]|uniref:Sigma-70 family RNA polymerase sigma factor n=1 Tax=Lentzea kristufekii TaxID=3095430 RepID=A0ABU4U4E4_9PSEU|nr:sigma-70 family RNA polymerase sigma factor [Lentzea sp. BCCO 10_0798]MDX8055448.1 sigma-70 family RNA polymerase sigma factor [Lentzea sp. BCCO 10_0798]
MNPEVEGLLRTLAPQVLGVLVRRHGQFDVCEDAVQEALLGAAQQWPADGIPDNPKGWLITAASRRWIEQYRSDTARRQREDKVVALTPTPPDPVPAQDDTLTLLALCCHESLTTASQIALTLRAVGGLTTAEIARAFLVPEATVAQRISRAKQKIKQSGAKFRPPQDLTAVLHVLYLIFTEGSTASSGDDLVRVDLTAEAIRLTRQLHKRRPADGELTGLLALMLLTDARRPARTDPNGALIPLAEQDRTRWDTQAIEEGTTLISTALKTAQIGPYQLQAAIAAVHADATQAENTDWHEILGLYDLLTVTAPGPMVSLNRIVAVAMVHGPRQALDELSTLDLDHYRVHAVRAHLLDLRGEHDQARQEYDKAAKLTLSAPEQRYLRSRSRHPR